MQKRYLGNSIDRRFFSVARPLASERTDAEAPAANCTRLRAFSLLELTISLFVLMVGLLGVMAAVRVHSRQMERVESWCRGNPTYYVVSQTDKWMRQLEAPADLNVEAGISAWTPPVAAPSQYMVRLESHAVDPATQSASATAQLTRIPR